MRPDPLTELTDAIYSALQVYANVHRGSGHFSLISTSLYEEARQIVHRYSGRNSKQYETIFCTVNGAGTLLKAIGSRSYLQLSSRELGLPLGISALVVRKGHLPGGVPPRTGGGVVKLVSRNSVVWSSSPEKYEAGTPAVINIIAFAKALRLTGEYGPLDFKSRVTPDFSVKDFFDNDAFVGMRGKELLSRLPETVVGKDKDVPTEKGNLVHVNLDNAASTPALKPVWDVFRTALSLPADHNGALVDRARLICRDFLRAPKEEYDIFFTGNTTDSLNIIAGNLFPDRNLENETVVLNTMLEHHSNELVWRCGGHLTLERLPVDASGFLDLSQLEKTLKAYNEQFLFGAKRVRIVAVCSISNVLGTVQDLKEISRICHKYGAKLLVDAAQSAAHREIDMVAHGVDLLALSGHKMYAPFGAGVLATRKGFLERGAAAVLRKNEEENVAGIAALGKAMNLLQRVGLETVAKAEHELTGKLLAGLIANSEVNAYGVTDPEDPRFGNRAGIVVFGMKQVPHNRVVKELAEKGGIGVRDGCFCAHIIVKDLLRIHPFREKLAEALLCLLPGLSHPSSLLPGLVRVSLGIENNEKEIQRFLEVLREIAKSPRTWVDRFIASNHNGTPFMRQTVTQKKMNAFTRDHIHKVFDSPEVG